MIEFSVLGATSLRDPSGQRKLASVLGQPKRLGLLAYLTLATKSGFIHRDTLMGMFWPESSQDRARNSLRQSLHRLRRALGAEVIVTNGEGIRVDHAELWCDATAFQQALDEDDTGAALELYTGELLPGLYLSECGEFEMWLEQERARLKHSAEAAVSALVDNGELDPTRAIPILRRALSWNRYDERTLRRLVSLLAASGDRADAIREYQAFRQLLAEDLAVDPSPETETLMEEIRENHTSVGDAPLGVEQLGPSGETVSPPAKPHPAAVVRRSWVRQRLTVVSGVVLAGVLAIGGTCVVNGRPDAASLDPTRVLVHIFHNETGDPALDALGRKATDQVTAGLTYIGFVEVVSLGAPPLSRAAASVADAGSLGQLERLRALGRANGAGTAVWGSYYLYGDTVQFDVHVTNAGTGEELASIEPVRGLVDAPGPAVEQLRDRVMTTLATLTDPLLAKWMRYASQPPTFEAYQEFVAGIELYQGHLKRRTREAIPHFLRAAALDSSFTMASLWAILAYSDRQWTVAESLARPLNARREQLVPLDRHFLDYNLARLRGDRLGALQAMRRVVEIAPGSWFLFQAGFAAMMVNRPREALGYFTRVNPESGGLADLAAYWAYVAEAHHMLGDYRRALEVARRGVERLSNYRNQSHLLWLQAHEIKALGALGRADELHELFEARVPLAQHPGWDAYPLPMLASAMGELRRHGHADVASDLVDRQLERFEGLSPADRDSLDDPSRRWLGKLLALAGREQEARALVPREPGLRARLEADAGDTNALGQLGVMLADNGDREGALEISRRLAQIGPRRNRLHFFGYPSRLRADIAAALGERERAIELLIRAFAEGLHFDTFYHIEYPSLSGYPPFEELIRPKG